MGVLGWTPDVVRSAGLGDLCDAMDGHDAAKGGFQAEKITAAFLRDMMNSFPDKEPER